MEQLAADSAIYFELYLIGDGPQKKDLLSYINSSRISNRVKWRGWASKKELKCHYQHADCLLNPSLYEGMPNTVLEGMACGLPVIASKVTGNDELVREGKTGYLFELNQTKIFQKRLASVLEEQESAWKLGVNGRNVVEKEFSWDKAAGKYLRLLINGEGYAV